MSLVCMYILRWEVGLGGREGVGVSVRSVMLCEGNEWFEEQLRRAR